MENIETLFTSVCYNVFKSMKRIGKPRRPV